MSARRLIAMPAISTLAAVITITISASAARAQPLDAARWQTILTTYATDDGGFRYAALRANAPHRAELDRFVAQVGEARPGSWPRAAQLAFYVNAYNAVTVKAVVDRWPIESVNRVPGFFDRVSHRVAGRRLTLNQLENDILLGDRFEEPRVHFAINCASGSCPPLSRRAYTAENLEAQLARQARAFVRRTTRRRDGALWVSRIFEWYADDFGGEAGVRAFVASRLDGRRRAAARDDDTAIRYAPYDWALNAR